MLTLLNSLFFYLQKALSVFLPPLFVFHTKSEFSQEFTQRRLLKKTHICQRSSLVVNPTPPMPPAAVKNNIKIKIELDAVLFKFLVYSMLFTPREMVTTCPDGGRSLQNILTSSLASDGICYVSC